MVLVAHDVQLAPDAAAALSATTAKLDETSAALSDSMVKLDETTAALSEARTVLGETTAMLTQVRFDSRHAALRCLF